MAPALIEDPDIGSDWPLQGMDGHGGNPNSGPPPASYAGNAVGIVPHSPGSRLSVV